MTFAAIPVARRQLPLHVRIATPFIALILLLGGAVIWNNYAETTRLMPRTADERFERIADKTARQLQMLSAPVAITIGLLAWQRLTFATSLTERPDSLGYPREALAQSEHLSALFIGCSTTHVRMMIHVFRETCEERSHERSCQTPVFQ